MEETMICPSLDCQVYHAPEMPLLLTVVSFTVQAERYTAVAIMVCELATVDTGIIWHYYFREQMNARTENTSKPELIVRDRYS